jgi:predicted metallopeptidase
MKLPKLNTQKSIRKTLNILAPDVKAFYTNFSKSDRKRNKTIGAIFSSYTQYKRKKGKPELFPQAFMCIFNKQYHMFVIKHRWKYKTPEARMGIILHELAHAHLSHLFRPYIPDNKAEEQAHIYAIKVAYDMGLTTVALAMVMEALEWKNNQLPNYSHIYDKIPKKYK